MTRLKFFGKIGSLGARNEPRCLGSYNFRHALTAGQLASAPKREFALAGFRGVPYSLSVFEQAQRPVNTFATTHWSVVVLAGQEHSQPSAAALEQLCRAYWYPLYAFVRASGKPREEALDLTQEFFARLLEKKWLAHADPTRGRFRTFLLTALKYFLVNEWHRDQCLKRGGGREFIELDALQSRIQIKPKLFQSGNDSLAVFFVPRRENIHVLSRARVAEKDRRTLAEKKIFNAPPVEGLSQLLGLLEVENGTPHKAAGLNPKYSGRFSAHHLRYSSMISNECQGASSSTGL